MGVIKTPATIICSVLGSIVSMITHIVLFKFKDDASKEDIEYELPEKQLTAAK